MKNAYRASACISLDALAYNIGQVRSMISPGTKLMCIVKADAYGHGACALAGRLLEMGADSFAVGTVEEGIELRRCGVKAPILILGYSSKEQLEDIIRNDLTSSVFTYAMAKDLDCAANELGMTASIEISIDTGMNMIGFLPDEDSVKRITMIASLLKNLKIQGIFTYFSTADSEEGDMPMQQAQRFTWMLKRLEESGVSIPCRHCANSAAIMKYPELNMDMVSAGIILYGLYPSDAIDPAPLSLKPVLTLKSHVVYIKTVPKGAKIGYGAAFTCQRETRVATIPVGYADGYPRAMSNCGHVLIGGNRYPIIGRICMDQLMVDITDAEDEIRQCDEVILFGKQGSEEITVEEIAEASASCNYEFVCGISRRVPRVYYQHGKAVQVVNYLI